MADQAARILDLTGSRLAAVTLDADGALVFERHGEPYRTYARPTPNSRASGAGDTFLAALTLALGAGGETAEAAELAAAASAVVVSKSGTAACGAEELLAHLTGGGKYAASIQALAACIEPLRQRGQRVVFTNGCFDLLHPGHISFLNRAKALGDVLIVGLNSDRGVAKLKGPGRPILSLEERVQLLSGLSSVDHIVAFDEDTPEALIRAIRPKVFVKGGGYSRDGLPEAAVVEHLGGSVHLLPYLEERSTRDIIQQIVTGSEHGRRGALAIGA